MTQLQHNTDRTAPVASAPNWQSRSTPGIARPVSMATAPTYHGPADNKGHQTPARTR